MLRFQLDNQTFEIGFRRFHKQVVNHDQPVVMGFNGAPAVNMMPSKFPSTEATITKVGEGLKKTWPILYQGVADCYHQDHFTL